MFVWENEYVSNDTQNNWKKNAYNICFAEQQTEIQNQTSTIELHATILFNLGMDDQPVVYLFIIFLSGINNQEYIWFHPSFGR